MKVPGTFESFGYEWTTFDRIKPEDHDVWTRWFADVPWEELSGARALDAGCGRGQFALFSAPRLGSIVALDGSLSVQVAARHLAETRNAHVVQADLLAAPFRPGAFDFIFSMGVLHHLEDPREGYLLLAQLLAPEGRLLIYVYSRPEARVRAFGLRIARAVRGLTVRTPRRLLRVLSLPIAAVLEVLFVWPGALGDRIGWRFLRQLPLESFRGVPFRSLWLGTFDLLAVPIEHRHSQQELDEWMEAAGLAREALRYDAGWAVLARRG